ncbi:MAG: hypothetical protein ABR525_09115 [Candidatus Limnocylindria bacterium]
MTGSRIDYVCVAAAHNTLTLQSSDTLVQDGRWAYCRAGVIEGHEWRRVTPVTIEELRAQARVLEPAGLSARP